MTNIKFYLTRIKRNLFTKNIKRNKIEGIPVIVLDLNTNKSYKYPSITKAAKYFDTHPKTIWRKVQSQERYLERYLIMERYYFYSKIYFNILKYISTIYKFFMYNDTIIVYILLVLFLFGYIMYKYLPYLVVLVIDIYNNYLNVEVSNLKYTKEEVSPLKKNIFNYLGESLASQKVEGLVEFNQEWRSVNLLKNKSFFIKDFPFTLKSGIYQSIINEINWDFQSKTNAFSTLHSSYSSPLIERVNINNIFSNAIASTRPSITIVDNFSTDSTTSLVINTQSISNNRNYSIIDNTLIWPRSPGRELLNYNSNVLYCLINGISPSTY